MKKRIGVITHDTVLYSKLRLLLRDTADVERLNVGYNREIYDLIFADTDDFPEDVIETVTMSRSKDADISIPFFYEDVISIINKAQTKSEDSIALLNDGRHILLSGEKIKLTEVEFRLLAELLAAKDGYVSRKTLLSRVWGDGFDAGVVNVYIHYLRSKLERDGRKIILSSRKEGYGIVEKYRREK